MKLHALPKTWIWSSLAEVALPCNNAIVDGPFGSSLKTSDYVPRGVPVLQGKNITNSQFEWKEIRYISEEKAEELKRSKVRIGDLLMVKIGSIGYSAYLDDLNGHGFAIIPANMAKVSFDTQKVNKRFAWHWLNDTVSVRELSSLASKTAQPALSLTKIKTFPIPLPPLAEQKRIAAILDKADAIRRKRQAAIKLADDFLRATFLDMFGDPVSNPKGWETLPLNKVGKVSTGSTPSSDQDGMFGGEIPFVTPGDLEGDDETIKRYVTKDGSKNSRTVREGATFVCCIGTIGKVGIAKEYSAFNQQINAVEWDNKIIDQYGYWAMRFLKKLVIKQAILTTLPILKKSEFEKIHIPIPPQNLQRDFSNILKKVDSLLIHKKAVKVESFQLFNSLAQRAFRGEL